MSIYRKFEFEKPAVGIKYSYEKPEGIELLDKQCALCEMVKEAHHRNRPFYFTKDNENCVGRMALGMLEGGPSSNIENVGVEFGIFQELGPTVIFIVTSGILRKVSCSMWSIPRLTS